MTPEQESALETVIGRQLTVGEIAALEPFLAIRNDVAITELLSLGRKRLVKHNIGKGDVLDAIGITAGNALLDAVEANTDFRHVKSELDRGDLDVSRPIVRQSLDAMAGVVPGFLQADAGTVKALAEVDNPVQLIDVSRALNNAEGITNGG